jgi:hypothetical protein
MNQLLNLGEGHGAEVENPDKCKFDQFLQNPFKIQNDSYCEMGAETIDITKVNQAVFINGIENA